ncbi:DinB family protein [Flavobacteriaceae bacterium]|nr:DinB family protein [Flavobacteriaceae bacterium]
MTGLIMNLESLVSEISKYVSVTFDEAISEKINSEKWSKKEIIGHLIDSGINNLQRFTEIQYNEKPYSLKSYNQNELVKANRYQEAETDELLKLLRAINKRIIEVITHLKEGTLDSKIVTEKGTCINLHFLIEDYVNHFEHHAKQIIK